MLLMLVIGCGIFQTDNFNSICQTDSSGNLLETSDECNSAGCFSPYPNPVTDTLYINYSQPVSDHIYIRIINEAEEIIKVLKNEESPAGNFEIYWDCTDDYATRVNAGYYRLIMTTGPNECFANIQVKEPSN
jgi:hypothetical protein